jgi:ATP-binding cassette subfamily D (ALD) protein 3
VYPFFFLLYQKFTKLHKNVKKILKIYIFNIDLATFIGYNVVSVPFLNPNSVFSKNSHSQRLEDYYQSGRMLVKLAEALGRISLAGRELTRLAGFTERVNQLVTVLDDLSVGKYQRTMVENKPSPPVSDEVDENGLPLVHANANSNVSLKPNSGKIIYKNNLIKYLIYISSKLMNIYYIY